MNGINDFTPVTEEQLAKISALSTPVYLEAVKEKNDELLAKIEENKKKTGFTINEAGEVSNEDLFASIISKYRGQANTSCSTSGHPGADHAAWQTKL